MVVFQRSLFLQGNKKEAPYASLLSLCGSNFDLTAVKLDDNHKTELNLDGVLINNDITIARLIAQSSNNNSNLMGTNVFESVEIDEILDLCESIEQLSLQPDSVLKNLKLSKDGTIFDGRITIADIALWSVISKSEKLQTEYSSLFKKILEEPTFANAHMMAGKFNVAKPSVSTNKEKQKDEGKFVELPGAVKGQVVVRFPPEASGYLHIGHAKAALLNQFYQQAFDGKLIFRFDDTNPAKENSHFEKVIIEDLALLNIKPDQWSHSSDHFEVMLEMCEKLLKDGKAFIDDTDTETMRKEREERVDSKNRNNSVETNMKLWEEMKKGSEIGLKCCARIKIDMKSNNGAMRDPTIYRCKPEEHVRTGTKYKVYPTYDFTCPIVDSIEGVTHTLRTTEYHDRDDQFYFICDALGLRKPHIWEYSRLNMTNTVMSKRKLTWFVDEKHVEGWDDPRLPTVRGVMRRGMTVEGLKTFIAAQGGSRSVVVMEWDKIWAFNKKVIDPVAGRYTALESSNLVEVIVDGASGNNLVDVALHPKNSEVGNKKIWQSSKIYIEQVDAREIQNGNTVTFINWGNMKITNVEKKGDNVVKINAQLDLLNKDFKKTLKVTWIGEGEKETFIPCRTALYDHIISKAVIGKDEDWKQFINYDSVHFTDMSAEPALRDVKKGDIIQLQRKGFYICDAAYQPKTAKSDELPLKLIYIPDGHVKESPGVKSSEGKKASAVSNNSGAALYADIEKQGLLVRDLKGKDPKSDATKAAIAKLLELKKSFKEATGQEYKPGNPPAAPVTASVSSCGATIYADIEKQGLLVRDLKGKDPKSDATKAAIAKLLELKKSFKEATGQEYKPGNPPAAPVTAPVTASVSSCGATIYADIEKQGLLVRDLKGKDPKSDATKAAIAKLLELKKAFKEATGQEYKPGNPPAAPVTAPVTASVSSCGATIYADIEKQGNLVRDLKGKDPKSDATKAAIAKLLELKKAFKEATGQEYKPGNPPAAPVTAPVTASVSSCGATIYADIEKQGNLVRDLKGKDPKSDATKAAIAKLLELKKSFKEATGQEYKPGNPPAAPVTASVSSCGATIYADIEKQGNLVRDLKGKDPKSDATKAAIAKLLELKKSFKEATGQEYKPGNPPAAQSTPKEASKPSSEKNKKTKPAKKTEPQADAADSKKQTKLGIDTKKEDNYSEWYSQVITKGEMIEYYDVSGCYVLRPWAYGMWEHIRKWFDTRIKRLGVKNCYFPMFVSQSALEREKDHIADFAPEVAWVTRAGSSEMSEPVAIRPTSETVMYPSYKKWVQSHRDLPIKLNQWCNVVRWEFKHPTPFLRTREFLWQEGHTAYADPAPAEKEVFQILDLYAGVYEELMAIPVVKGRKSEKEKFAGGKFTTTVEAYVPVNGRGVQGATSHHLGQNFSKMFDISYENPDGNGRAFAWQNSWGLTTRTIGTMIMVHGDDNGLVIPPRIATIQVIIVPVGITANLSNDDKEKIFNEVDQVAADLLANGVRAEADSRENYSPGWKFNHWELKGVPIRIEIGPKDLSAGVVTAVIRHNSVKETIKRSGLNESIKTLLETIHNDMINKVRAIRDAHMKVVYSFDEFRSLLDEKFILLAPFCGLPDCEDNVKRDSVREDGADGAQMGAKTLCIPLEQPDAKVGDKCIHPSCNKKPEFFALFGRSY